MVKIAICEDDIFYMKKAKQLVEDFFKERELRLSLITFQSGIELTKNFRENYDIIFEASSTCVVAFRQPC